MVLAHNPMNILEEISQVVEVPIKFIHVIRNPFDNIATMFLRRTKSRDIVRKEDVKVRKVFNTLFTLDHSVRKQCVYSKSSIL